MSTSKVQGPSKMFKMLPHSVTVGVRKYDVWYDRDAATATGARGQAMCDEGRIMLDPRLSHSLQNLTLLHEMFHCAFEQSTLTAGKAVKDAEVEVTELLEEKLCTWLETVVPQLVRDNPDLFKELMT